MFNRKSIYALNKKDPDAIVYMDANEVIVRLTREDFASEEEFLKWKALSDEDYHASEKEAHVYANHTLALDELSEEAASIPAVDVCMEQAHDRAEAIHRSVKGHADSEAPDGYAVPQGVDVFRGWDDG